jgi:hypothetical protein
MGSKKIKAKDTLDRDAIQWDGTNEDEITTMLDPGTATPEMVDDGAGGEIASGFLIIEYPDANTLKIEPNHWIVIERSVHIYAMNPESFDAQFEDK